ncbi:hypothetical protein LPL18_007440 [Halomonas sp. CUBES01]|uniref:P-loop ATPase, Sll1717 family n=1 Tax=Halomonas sp. CUBES01 TaxID=2897340 RepID=UPI001E581145|nr:hypothetical protein [Halomonas sp. CUBES01]MEC4767170.1 hypothetical protein [Halomonas sp. CUBES01]
MTSKIEVLKSLELGARVAEDEVESLEKYFVETDQWRQISSGKIDVVYGPKGSGKSALYTLLNRREDHFFDEGILLSSGENVRGATVFSHAISDPPPSEVAFIYLWKLYCLTLIARTLREYEINNDAARALVTSLEKAKLLPESGVLSVMFRAVSSYIKRWFSRDAKAIEHAVTIDSSTGAPTVSRKMEFREQSDDKNLSEIPADELLHFANLALEQEGLKMWLLFDRLDVAFADSPEMERNALRALFRAYNDMKGFSSVALKIFVRDDIWKRITEGGFTEASHITRTVNITWSENSLMNLVVSRIVANTTLSEFLNINPEEVRKDYSAQRDVFYRIAPEKVDTGRNPYTFGWILSRTVDASRDPVPREVIHLLDAAKSIQVQKLERGEEDPGGDILLDRAAFKESLPQVSKTRFEQTLLAEYGDVGEYVMKLEGERSEQTVNSLAHVWGVTEEEAGRLARRLAEIGFFEIRGDKNEPSYWVPFIYRPALNLVQGKAA